MDINLKNLDTAQLKVLMRSIEHEQIKRKNSGRDELITEIRRLAATKGFVVTTLVLEDRHRQASNLCKKSPVKYVDPKNPTTTWTGLGRPPAWYKNAIAEGTPESAMRVKQSAVGNTSTTDTVSTAGPSYVGQ